MLSRFRLSTTWWLVLLALVAHRDLYAEGMLAEVVDLLAADLQRLLGASFAGLLAAARALDSVKVDWDRRNIPADLGAWWAGKVRAKLAAPRDLPENSGPLPAGTRVPDKFARVTPSAPTPAAIKAALLRLRAATRSRGGPFAPDYAAEVAHLLDLADLVWAAAQGQETP